MSNGELLHFVSEFAGQTVAVVGDLMLDRYIWGRASRISQEAPVPVVHVAKETEAPGGGANVVRNLSALGAKVAVFGCVGTDRAGDHLCSTLGEEGADVTGVVHLSDRATTVKTRVLAGNQQVARVDREITSPVSENVQERLLEALRNRILRHGLQAVILEDYAKGLLTPALVNAVVSLCAEHNVMVALDPHPSHPYNVSGIRLLTPNRSEAFALAGRYYRPGRLPLSEDTELIEVGQVLLEQWNAEILLVTLGGQGMALFTRGENPRHIPTQAREVFDVSGAGDTVITTFVLGLLAGASPMDAARLANHAAGIVVAEVGTAAVTISELQRELEKDGSEEEAGTS